MVTVALIRRTVVSEIRARLGRTGLLAFERTDQQDSAARMIFLRAGWWATAVMLLLLLLVIWALVGEVFE
jgi:hypothetical protein